MTSKFEQLIEYVINDEEAKAKELFHDIVVEKSREIYENLMQEEEVDESEELDEEEELDEADESEEVEESFGGDAADQLMNDVATNQDLGDEVDAEEQGVSEEEESDAEFDDEAEEDGEELTHDIEADHDEGSMEDRVVDLEDKLDELMAEFESLMGDDGIESDLGGEEGDEVEGDAMAADDTMAFAESDEALEEGIELTKVAPAKMGDDGANNKSVVAFNSGAAGMEGSPVKMTGDTAKGRPAPSVGSISNEKFQNTPASGSKKLSPATKPHLAQATGVNTKTPFPKG
jgi:hypothetical protein